MKPSRGPVRILLDTNVLISGLLGKNTPPGELLRLWTEDKFLLVTSTYQLDELRRVFEYRHLRSKIDPEESATLLDNIDAKAIVARELPDVDLSADPKDNPILATALAGEAELIVSGDKPGMQKLRKIGRIPIVTSREALKRLGL